MKQHLVLSALTCCSLLGSCTTYRLGSQRGTEQIVGSIQLDFLFEDNTQYTATADLGSYIWSGKRHWNRKTGGADWSGEYPCKYSLLRNRLKLTLIGEQKTQYMHSFLMIYIAGEFADIVDGNLVGPFVGTAIKEEVDWARRGYTQKITPQPGGTEEKIRGRVTGICLVPLVLIPESRAVPAEIDPRLTWLREQAIQLHSISPSDEDFADLQPLKQIIGDARIVMLGEQSHGDGTTFHAKTRLIKFLHQEMGFDVLAFESGLYDCSKAWQFLQRGMNPVQAVRWGVHGIWSRSHQVQPLIAYLGEKATTAWPLELSGFDCQFTGKASRELLIPDLEDFLDRNGSTAIKSESWAQFKRVLRKLIQGDYYHSIPTENEKEFLTEVLGSLQTEMDTFTDKEDDPTTLFWIQLLRSIEMQAASVWSADPENPGLQGMQLRDLQMGRNLIWLANKCYPDRKIIVWAATYHIMRNIFLPGNVKPMGQTVWQTLGSQVYTLGFTAYEGQVGFYFQSPHDIGPAAVGSLEDLIQSAGLQYAIVDFRNPPAGGEWLSEEIISWWSFYLPLRANWTGILDGIVFMKVMTPSIPAER